MEKVEEAVLIDEILLHNEYICCSRTFTLEIKSSDINYLLEEKANTLFRKLAQKFETESFYGNVIPVDLSSYAHIQQKRDDSLLILWNCAVVEKFKDHAPKLDGAEAVRTWLKDPTNTDLLSRIGSIKLWRKGLEIIPPEITCLQGLKVLELDGNRIKSIPEYVCDLKKLQVLHLYNNQIEVVPNCLFEMDSLREIHLGYNCIGCLSESVGKMKRLQLLDLSGNQIEIIPESIGDLENLRILSFSHNKIITLPKSIGNLELLQTLFLQHNQIARLPESIANLKLLKKIKISKNPMEAIPEFLRQMEPYLSIR